MILGLLDPSGTTDDSQGRTWDPVFKPEWFGDER